MTVDELIRKYECQELILRRARLLDLGQLEDERSLFTKDAIVVGPRGEQRRVHDVPAEERQRVTSNLAPRVITNIAVTLTGSDTAQVTCYVTLPREELPQGEWTFDVVKTDEGWRISRYEAAAIGPERSGAH